MKKQCELIDAYLDGSLKEPQKSEFESHLSGCRNCHRECLADGDLDDLIRGAWSQISAPHSVLTPATSHISSTPYVSSVLTTAVLTVAAVVMVAVVMSAILNTDFTSKTTISQNEHQKQEQSLSQLNGPTPVATVLDSGAQGDAVLLMRKQTSSAFTIVQALKPLTVDSTNTLEPKEFRK